MHIHRWVYPPLPAGTILVASKVHTRTRTSTCTCACTSTCACTCTCTSIWPCAYGHVHGTSTLVSARTRTRTPPTHPRTRTPPSPSAKRRRASPQGSNGAREIFRTQREARVAPHRVISYHRVKPTVASPAWRDPRCRILAEYVRRESGPANWYSRCLPHFALLGTPKSGSTSLFNWLLQHPQLSAPQRKELHMWAPVLQPDKARRRPLPRPPLAPPAPPLPSPG